MSVALYTPSSSQIVHEARVDFRQRVIQPMIHIVQYDKSLPIVAVELYSDGQKWPLPVTVATVKVRWGKRDHTYVYTDVLGCNADRTVVYIEIIEQMTVFYGEHNPVLEVAIGDTIACSSYIPFYIDRNPIQRDDIESQVVPGVVEQIYAAIALKQDILVSGTNIKTINGQSILGSGDITISGGGTSIEAITTWSSTVAGYTALVGVDIGGTKYRMLPLGTSGNSQESIAIGLNSTTLQNNNPNGDIAIGYGSIANGQFAVAIGNGSKAYGNSSVCVGYYAESQANLATALGRSAKANGVRSVAIGRASYARSEKSIAIGDTSEAYANCAMAIGYGTYTKIENTASFYGYAASDGTTNVYTILLKSPSEIFFANETPTSTTNGYTQLSQFTAGKTLKDYLDSKQATLVAGTNITLLTNQDGSVTINASGGSQVPMGTTYGTGDLAIGSSSVAGASGQTYYATAYGTNAISTGAASVAVGYGAKATGGASTALGYIAESSGHDSTAIGRGSEAKYVSTLAVGKNAKAQGNYSSALGTTSVTDTNYAYQVAIGAGSYTKASYSVAIGNNSSVYISESVSIDGLSNNRILQIYTPENIFFRNESVNNTKTTQAAYTNGHTLADYMFAYATDAEIEAIFN